MKRALTGSEQDSQNPVRGLGGHKVLLGRRKTIGLPDNVRPRGAFISVGDCTPTEKDLLLLTTCRSGSLLD